MLATPIWLYQLWAFLAPGLHKAEKKYALGFVGAGFPLFLAGAFFAYKILPTTATVLIGFTPANVDNLLPLDDYLDLVTRMVVVFGLSFELPLLLVLLNFAGILSGKKMLGWWRGMIMGITVFAAIATPSTDPLSMLALAGPIWVLYFIAVAISILNDRRRRLPQPRRRPGRRRGLRPRPHPRGRRGRAARAGQPARGARRRLGRVRRRDLTDLTPGPSAAFQGYERIKITPTVSGCRYSRFQDE